MASRVGRPGGASRGGTGGVRQDAAQAVRSDSSHTDRLFIGGSVRRFGGLGGAAKASCEPGDQDRPSWVSPLGLLCFGCVGCVGLGWRTPRVGAILAEIFCANWRRWLTPTLPEPCHRARQSQVRPRRPRGKGRTTSIEAPVARLRKLNSEHTLEVPPGRVCIPADCLSKHHERSGGRAHASEPTPFPMPHGARPLGSQWRHVPTPFDCGSIAIADRRRWANAGPPTLPIKVPICISGQCDEGYFPGTMPVHLYHRAVLCD